MVTRSDPKAFKQLEEAIAPYMAKGRTASASFLIWFLETVYRLDTVEAQDAVCDSRLDAGIDALIVNDNQREVVLFQAKRREKLPAALGDKDLKTFVGSLTQFRDPRILKEMERSTENIDLKRLLSTYSVAKKIEQGYTIRPIFVANVTANEHAEKYLESASHSGVAIDLWDLGRLAPILDQLEREWFIEQPITLRIADRKVFVQGSLTTPELVFAAIPATELVKLPGIDDTRLFAQNVRLGLGKTRVNKEIIESVKNKDEHSSFLRFHNGLTIVAKEVRVRGSQLHMNGYSVCNGCQSMLIFYDNRQDLTRDMEILVRVVRVEEGRAVAESIAYRTNNQNPISLRDLRSNADTQVQLKAEFDQLFGFDATYAIKSGELSPTEEFSNEYAGRLLLALYVGQPWSSHQKYRIFGNLEHQVFRYGITAANIRLTQLFAGVVQEEC